MKKRFLAMLLVVVMTTMLLPATALAATSSVSFAGGDGTAQNPYQVATAEQLNAVRDELSAHYVLVSDIDLSGDTWIPIGTTNAPFSGSFDGAGHTISRLTSGYFSSENYAGLFGYCDTGYIYNVHIKDSAIVLTLSDRGVNAGGIVGSLGRDGRVEGCTYDGSIQITITGSYGSSVGGIVGWSQGEITSCTNNSNIVVDGVDGYDDAVGGIVGTSYADIENCKNNGDVSSDDYAGGIIGTYNSRNRVYPTVSSCSNNGEISAKYAGGITAKASDATIDKCANSGRILSNGSASRAAGIVAYTTDTQIRLCENTADVYSNADTSYNAFAAGIVANAIGTTEISQCRNSGEISASTKHTGSWYDTTPAASAFGGGIVSTTSYSIEINDCYNTGKIMASASDAGYGGYYSSKGYAYSGGIAGRDSGVITNCYNMGDIYTYDADYCYEGTIAGSTDESIEIKNCYFINNPNVSATGDSKATLLSVSGCTDSQLRQQSTYVNFDFSSVWYFDSTGGYPYPQLRGLADDSQIPDVPPVPGDGSILALSPANGATNVGYDASNPPVFKITFDREIASSADQEFVADVDLTLEDTFAIYRKSDDALIYKPSADSHLRFTLTSDKKTLVVTPLNNHALLNANTEYYVAMGDGFVKFADNSTSPAISKGNWAFKTELFEKNGTFTFRGSNGKNIEYSYFYSDDFFYDTGNMYNHDLANMSLNLAMSAFNSLEAPASNYNEFVAAKNVRKLLSDLNFKSIETNIDDGNNGYSGMPYTNSIAAAYAQKNITTDYGEFTLIAIAIRGGGYEAEWGGNFTVGQNGNHKGFQLASDKVLAGLKKYINSQDVSGDIKIWITGYSRAAATANLTAAAIDDGKLFTGTDAVDNSAVRLSTADVYAYTFETPMGTTNNTASFLYNNIFNIVNPIDLVPKVAPDAWNFGRYGITYYMPSGNTNAVGYSDVIMRVTREYSKIINGSDSGNLLAIKQLTNQNAILDKFLDILSAQMPRTTYSPKYEHLLVPIASEVMGADGNQYGENIFWAIEEFCLRYPDDAADLINALKEAVGNKIVWYIAAEQGFEQLYKALGWNGSTAIDTISMIGEIIFQSHYPEVTMAWMRTINGADGYGSGKYRKLYVNCPVDVSVYDSNNRLVAQIINDDPQLIEDSTIGSYIDGDGQKIVILPTDMEYHVVINATDNGTMTYTVDEYNIDKATTERIVSYSEIGITKDEVLTGLVENLDDVQKANYPLYRENETTPLKPDVNNEGDGNNQPDGPTQPSTPTTPNYGGGSSDSSPTYGITIPSHVTGGTVQAIPTSASEGQRVTLTVTPDSGYELSKLIVTDGKGNELKLIAKDDRTYTFTMPNSKATVEAIFTKIWSNPFSDVSENSWYYDAVKFANENGLMSGIGNGLFTPEANLTRAQFAQILYNKEGRPAVEAGSNFVDVASGTWYTNAVNWAAANSIVSGYGDGRFGPNDNITREQLAVMLWRYAGSPAATNKELNFTDADKASGYALNALCWVVENGIINGYGNGKLGPQGLATRAQVAQMLKNYLEK